MSGGVSLGFVGIPLSSILVQTFAESPAPEPLCSFEQVPCFTGGDIEFGDEVEVLVHGGFCCACAGNVELVSSSQFVRAETP